MKTIIVFDLKGTLVQKDELIPEASELLEQLKEQGFETMLYSMNETWSYRQLQAWPDTFALFDKVLLVSIKEKADLASLKNYQNVLVVGDGINEELEFAKYFGYEVVEVNSPLNTKQVLEKAQRYGS